MLDRAEGRTGHERLPVPLRLSTIHDARSQLRAGLTGLSEQLALFDEVLDIKTSPLPLKEGETETEFLAKLEVDLAHLESLVKPYDGKDVVTYLKGLETAMSTYSANADYLGERLGIRIQATKPVRHLQARFAAVSHALEQRKKEAFGDQSIFIGKTITTHTIDGREITRKIKSVPPAMPSDHFHIWLELNNNDGATSEFVSLTSIKRLSKKRTSYGPTDGESASIESYIRKCFGNKEELITNIELSAKGTVVYMKSKSGRVWSVHCKFNEKPQDAFGTPALLIEKVSNWQKIIPDPLLNAYQGQRVTSAQIDGIMGYMNMNEPQEPKTFSDKLLNFTDNILDKGARQAHRIGNWFRKKFL